MALIAAVIAIIGAVLSWTSSERAAIDLRRNNDELKLKTKEIAALTKDSLDLALANAELSRALSKKTDTIAQLSQSAIDNVTGGASFCYFTLGYPEANAPMPMLIAVGNNPIYDLEVRIVDLEIFDRLNKEVLADRRPRSLATFAAAERSLKLSDAIPPNAVRILHEIPWPKLEGDAKNYNVFFIARNGAYSERLRLRRVNGVWKSALEVGKERPGRGMKSLMKPIIDKEFPRGSRGEIEW